MLPELPSRRRSMPFTSSRRRTVLACLMRLARLLCDVLDKQPTAGRHSSRRACRAEACAEDSDCAMASADGAVGVLALGIFMP